MTNTPENVLLTGGRAPVTLELCRLFEAAGHRVFVGESMKRHLCRRSSAVYRCIPLPPPRQEPGRFLTALKEAIEDHEIDLLVPTCEEVFYVSMVKDELPSRCQVFTDGIDRLGQLHHKLEFIRLAQELELPVPETHEVSTKGELRSHIKRGRDIVLKPSFSRFSSHVVVLPRTARDIKNVQIGEQRRWVVQEYLGDNQRCTYAVAIDGTVRARATYESHHRAGAGSSIYFESKPDPRIDAWVTSFIDKTSYTGQIAFDFLITDDGRALPIECNPRATSGLHLFQNSDDVTRAFFDVPLPAPIEPNPDYRSMIGLLMLLYGLPASLLNKGGRRKALRRWLRDLRSAEDVIYRTRDKGPVIGQLETMGEIMGIAGKSGVTLLEATTADIEWNGEDPLGLHAGT